MFPGTCHTLRTFCWRICWIPATCHSPITRPSRNGRTRSRSLCKSRSGSPHPAFGAPSRKRLPWASRLGMPRAAGGLSAPQFSRRPHTCIIASGPLTQKATWPRGFLALIRQELESSGWNACLDVCWEYACRFETWTVAYATPTGRSGNEANKGTASRFDLPFSEAQLLPVSQ